MRVERAHGRLELRSRQALQHSKRVFKLSSLLLQKCQLSVGRIKHSLLLRYIETRDGSARMSSFDQVQSLLLECNRLLYHGNLRIQFSQLEVVGCQFRADQ